MKYISIVRNKTTKFAIAGLFVFLFVCGLPAVLIHGAMASLSVDLTVGTTITVIFFIAGITGIFIFLPSTVQGLAVKLYSWQA